MKVLLLDNIRGVGLVGDIKEVSDGYGRNFLLPQGKARAASEGAIRDSAALIGKRKASLATAVADAEVTAGKLSGTIVELTGKANEKGTLFAGITPADISLALSEKTGLHFQEQQIVLSEPLKSVGEHPVSIDLTAGVTTQIVVLIKAL